MPRRRPIRTAVIESRLLNDKSMNHNGILPIPPERIAWYFKHFFRSSWLSLA